MEGNEDKDAKAADRLVMLKMQAEERTFKCARRASECFHVSSTGFGDCGDDKDVETCNDLAGHVDKGGRTGDHIVSPWALLFPL
jgi:hypothetical protein